MIENRGISLFLPLPLTPSTLTGRRGKLEFKWIRV